MGVIKKAVKKVLGKDKKKYSVNEGADAAKQELESESEETKRQRVKLFYTAGGSAGEEIEEVKKRKRVLGN